MRPMAWLIFSSMKMTFDHHFSLARMKNYKDKNLRRVSLVSLIDDQSFQHCLKITQGEYNSNEAETSFPPVWNVEWALSGLGQGAVISWHWDDAVTVLERVLVMSECWIQAQPPFLQGP